MGIDDCQFWICDLRLDNLDFSQRNGVAEIHNGVANERKAQGLELVHTLKSRTGSYRQPLAGNVVINSLF